MLARHIPCVTRWLRFGFRGSEAEGWGCWWGLGGGEAGGALE